MAEYKRMYYIENREYILKQQKINDNNRKEEKRAYNKSYNKSHRRRLNIYSRTRYAPKLKQTAYDVLGNKCLNCGVSDIRVLQIDHINGGGSKERRKLDILGIYRKIIKTNGDGYQILCANCNWIKTLDKNEIVVGTNTKSQIGQRYWQKLKNNVLEILGNKCIKCGTDDLRVLQVDHINGNGSREKAIISTPGIYRKVITNNGKGYQVLCANCNWIKRHENKEYK